MSQNTDLHIAAIFRVNEDCDFAISCEPENSSHYAVTAMPDFSKISDLSSLPKLRTALRKMTSIRLSFANLAIIILYSFRIIKILYSIRIVATSGFV